MVGLAGKPATTFPITANFQLVRFSAAALSAGPRSRSRPLIEQRPQISFQFGLWKPQRAPSWLRRQPVVLLWEWLALRRADLSAVEEQCLPTLVRVVGQPMAPGFRDGARSPTRPAKLVSGTAPPSVSPTNPNGFLADSRSGHPRLNHQPPNLNPQPAATPLTPVLFPPVREAYRPSALERVLQAVPCRQKRSRSSLRMAGLGPGSGRFESGRES